MNEENLWGEIPIDERIKTPAAILRGQAALLNKLTRGVLDGRVITRVRDEMVEHELLVVVPGLSNYSVSIVTIDHGIELYPVCVHEDFAEDCIAVQNEESLRGALGKVFQSRETKRMISSLLAQGRDPEEDISDREEAAAD